MEFILQIDLTLKELRPSEFGHLAIAVSPRLEVEISGHASLDGCNFQRKRPGPHGVPPAPPCVHRLPLMRLMILIYNAGNLHKLKNFFFYINSDPVNDYQLGLRITVIFRSEYDVYILFSHYHCYWWFGDAMSWDPFLLWPLLLAWINFNPIMDK